MKKIAVFLVFLLLGCATVNDRLESTKSTTGLGASPFSSGGNLPTQTPTQWPTPLTTSAGDIADLVTLSGVAPNAEHLGTFTGSTIADSSTIYAALQAIETALEADPSTPVTLDANADALLSLSTQEIGLDTQTANTGLMGPTSGAAAVPTMRASVDADIPDTITASNYTPKVPSCLTAAPGSPSLGQIECADGDNWQIDASQGTDDWLVRYRVSDTTWVGFYNITDGVQIVSQIDETVPIADGDGTGSLLWAFAFGAQRIITVPGDAAQTLATLEAGNVFTGANDFGGATSVELPNGTNPTVDATGETAVDTDGANESGDMTYRTFDGTNTVAMARKINCYSTTAIKPQDFADSERDLFPWWANNSGMTFTITEIKAWSDTDNTTVAVELVTATNWSSPSAVDALEIATDGTGVYTDTQTTITDATVAHDEILTLDFDDTDDPGVVHVTVCGWYNGAVD